MNIILYLLQLCHYLYQQNCWLINFICKYIPLKQWDFDDSHSPKYQKFKVDRLPKIIYHHQGWDWKDLNRYYTWKYGKPISPVKRRPECDIPEKCTCPACSAPQPYLYRNNGKGGQLLCKVCGTRFASDENRFSKTVSAKNSEHYWWAESAAVLSGRSYFPGIYLFFKVHLSHFFMLGFFIRHLTLSPLDPRSRLIFFGTYKVVCS